MSQELPEVQAGFGKGRGSRDQIANIHWITEKKKKKQKKNKGIPEKHLLLLHWLCKSLWLCGSWQIGQSLKRWEYQTTLPVSWETYVQDKKWQWEPDMEQDWFKIGKEYIKVAYGYLACLTYIQSTPCEMSGWMNHKLESRLPGEISTTSDVQMISL